MTKKMNKEKIIAATATALLVLSLIGTGLYYRSNGQLKKSLDGERLTSETLLSEKLALQKEAEKLKQDIVSWKGRSEEADRLLNGALDKITQMEKTIGGLRKENAGIASLKKELNELKQMRSDLEKQLAALEEKNRQQAAELQLAEAELLALRSERDQLKANIDLMIAGLTDDFRVESHKGNRKQKLTVSAAKTKKLTVSFEIPQSLSDDVRFNITTPTGRIVKSGDKSLTYNWVGDDRPMTASLSPYSGEFEVSRRMEMVYAPDQKLAPGIYKIQVYNGDSYAGGCQVKLK